MVDEQDWRAITSSEVFRNYVALELNKEAQEEANKPTPDQIIDSKIDEMDKALAAFDEFENQIRKNPELFVKFKNVQAYLMRNPDAHDKIDPGFIKGIMMLNLEDK